MWCLVDFILMWCLVDFILMSCLVEYYSTRRVLNHWQRISIEPILLFGSQSWEISKFIIINLVSVCGSTHIMNVPAISQLPVKQSQRHDSTIQICLGRARKIGKTKHLLLSRSWPQYCLHKIYFAPTVLAPKLLRQNTSCLYGAPLNHLSNYGW